MAILNPIVNAGVLAIDGNLEPEARLQGLLRCWLGTYFSGSAFTTRATTTTTTSKTFIACDFMWQDDKMPVNPQKPIIHVVFSNDGTERLDLAEGMFGHCDKWLLEVILKVPGTLSATPLKPGTSEQLARRLAGQALWLFSSGERDALTAQGIYQLKIEHPPVAMNAGVWHQRMMMASCVTRREQAR